MGIGNASHGVGDARPGGDQRHTQTACELGMGMGHVDGRSFVPNINDANAFGVQPHPDRHDVAAAQAKHPVHAPLFKKPRDHGRS